MKSLSISTKLVLLAAISIGMLVPMTSRAAAQSPDSAACKAQTVSSIVVNGNTANATFTIPAGCPLQEVSLTSYKTPSTYFPLSQQKMHAFTTGSYTAGTHTASVNLPGEDCAYQVDLFWGGPNTVLEDIDYSSVVMAYKLDGSQDCRNQEETPPAAPTAPEAPVTVKPAAAAIVKETPSAPAPSSLPNTGPGSTAAIFVGVSALGSLAYHMLRRRFGASF